LVIPNLTLIFVSTKTNEMKPKIKKRNLVEYSMQVGEHGAKARSFVHEDKRNKAQKKHPKKYLGELLNN